MFQLKTGKKLRRNWRKMGPLQMSGSILKPLSMTGMHLILICGIRVFYGIRGKFGVTEDGKGFGLKSGKGCKVGKLSPNIDMSLIENF